jgi:YidC/Oxa1 family membrane protein insertase
MDRTTVIGFILIGIVLMVWMWMNAPPPGQPAPGQDSLSHRTSLPVDTQRVPVGSPPKESAQDSLGKFFSPLLAGTERSILIKGSDFVATLSTRGGLITQWVLKKYTTWNGYPVDLINREMGGDFSLVFYTSDGKLIDTRNLRFDLLEDPGGIIDLNGRDSAAVDFVLNVTHDSRIIKRLVFRNDSYDVNVEYRFEGMESVISNYEYQVVWETGLNYQERNSIDESNSAMAYSYSGGELTELDAAKFDEPPVKQTISGRVTWVATRNKYFSVAIIPRSPESSGAYLEGYRKRMPDNGAKEFYNLVVKMPFLGKPLETSRFTIFLGPLDYDIVRSHAVDLERIMSFGAAWIIRPISQYVLLPLFQFIHFLIPNYGLVIIVFSLIIKVVLYPLTKSSMTSMRKMQALSPMMEELREKYKDDPQKMNLQTMRLYKEYGVNPAGGCLPMLLQLPILYALWGVFRSTIQLRQANFVWWIHDLSIPDTVAKLPFPLPIFNITEISGLAALMGITMFVQQKMSVKDPRQKMMVWLMPLMMTLLFNSFPSGLNLYYLVFNVFSIAQQAYVNKQHKDEPLRKVEQKKKSSGFLGRLTKDMPRLK